MTRIRSISLAVVLTMALMFTALSALAPRVQATHMPADKIGVSASTIEVMDTTQPQPVTLLTATLRTSSPTDLMIKVTGECALWTNVSSPDGLAQANVKVWVEMDGAPVPVTSDPAQGGPDDGKVVFCNREFQVVSIVDVLQLFLRTRAAQAFNWVTLNVGSGIHTIEVKGRLDTLVAGTGVAKAAVGKRTLIVEPAKLANDVTI